MIIRSPSGATLVMVGLSALLSFGALLWSTADLAATGKLNKVIVDADPGADDAMAIFMMLSQLSQYDVIAITTVTVNTGIVNGTKNTLRVLQTANMMRVPVYMGSDQGLVKRKLSDGYFGEDGLGDFPPLKPVPPMSLVKKGHAALAIVDLVKKNPGEITLLCLGPLTNIALALHIYPELFQNVNKTVILGGSYQGLGNVKPGIEFNAYADPEAASLVYSKSTPDSVMVIPMEVPRGVSTSMDWRINVLGKINSDAVKFLNQAERKTFSKERWSPYDPLAAAVLLRPDVVIKTMEVKVLVETCGDYLQGAYIMDYKSKSPTVTLVTDVDKSLLKQILIDYLSQ